VRRSELGKKNKKGRGQEEEIASPRKIKVWQTAQGNPKNKYKGEKKVVWGERLYRAAAHVTARFTGGEQGAVKNCQGGKKGKLSRDQGVSRMEEPR